MVINLAFQGAKREQLYYGIEAQKGDLKKTFVEGGGVSVEALLVPF